MAVQRTHGHRGRARAFRLLILLVLPFVVASKCAVLFSSGDSEDDEDDGRGLKVVVNEGQFVDAPVHGLRYTSGSLAGFTDSQGRFRYEAGSDIAFFIGDVALGGPVPGKGLITPLDLVPAGTSDTPAVINIARLLQSLDAVAGDGIISIPKALHDDARLSNALVAPAIEHLEFADDTAFVNAASQLVSVLTAQYPHTASLVEPPAAREHLLRSLASLSPPGGREGAAEIAGNPD